MTLKNVSRGLRNVMEQILKAPCWIRSYEPPLLQDILLGHLLLSLARFLNFVKLLNFPNFLDIRTFNAEKNSFFIFILNLFTSQENVSPNSALKKEKKVNLQQEPLQKRIYRHIRVIRTSSWRLFLIHHLKVCFSY